MLKGQHTLVHGALTTVSVAFLFPMGMLVMKARSKITLRLHLLLLQLSGAVGCLLGVGFAIFNLEVPIPVSTEVIVIDFSGSPLTKLLADRATCSHRIARCRCYPLTVSPWMDPSSWIHQRHTNSNSNICPHLAREDYHLSRLRQCRCVSLYCPSLS